jgi:glycosyltransferase involved in cell wall biosynthesis
VVLDTFAQLATRYPDPRLAWIGEGDRREDFRRAAADAGLSGRVLLPGKVAHEDIPVWMNASDVVILASSSEGLPNSLVEASACARPVVASRVGGVPEVVADGETGLLVPSGDPGQMAEAIGALLDDPERARRMGECGRTGTVARFCWERHGEQTVEVYRSLLETGS